MAEGESEPLELQLGADLEALEFNDGEGEEEAQEEDEEEEEEFVITEQLDEETQSLAAGLASRQSDELLHALQEMLKVLATPKRGGRVLRQYVLASPKCAELVSAWELGVGAPTAVPLMLVLAELLRHSRGKGGSSDDRQKAKALVVVQSRLDKLARVIGRSKVKDIYSHLSSKQRSRQKAALKLLSSVVLRGKLLAVDVATSFDFTLEALKKLAQHPFKAPASSKNDGLLHQSTRFFFIEFALSFLVVGDPGLLRWILQKRPLYAGVLHGLAKDGEPTIIQVLRVFQEKVMAPAALVPAGLQSVLFGDVALEQLARIAGDELFGESADVAYETLMALCTDPSHGLCPEYASPWESANVKAGAYGGNQGRLLRLLLRLRVTEAFRHRELLLTTARIRPRLAAAYLDAVPYSLEPRPSPTWFTIMSLVADLIHISSAPPPFVSMALRGLPIPAPDGSLVRSNLRHLLPRALTKVALNRGLQHADVLVKHASLRLLLESLLSLELLLDGAYAAAESTCPQEKSGFSSYFSESTWGIEASGLTLVPQKSSNTLRADEQESKRLQWLGLVESIQDIMRATLPDPNILLLINSTINSKSGSLKESKGSLKRSQPVVEAGAGAGKRRKKDDGYAVDEGDGAHLTDSNSNIENEVDEHEDNSSALQTLAQIWGSEAIANAEGLTEPLLHAKVLEVLAAYQRVLPVAFADKGFDPFKLLPSDPLRLSLAQQKAFLSLLLASTGAPRNVSQGNRTTYRLVEAGGSGSVYKHVKPLLKLMMGSTVDHIRDSTHLLASRIMVSTGAFESNTWESTLWLDHLFRLEGKAMNTRCKSEDSLGDNVNQHVLGSIGECVLGFLADAVGSVGRTLYKYFDQLFSLISAHSLGEESSGHSKDLPGLMVPEFGPFVLCALEHTLRVVRSDSKSLTLPQRSAIVLYVAGVVNDLLRMQTDPRALGIVITSLLSSESLLVTGNPDKDTTTLGIEWTPLQALYRQAQLFLSGETILPTPEMPMSNLKMSESSGQLSDVLTACGEASEGDLVKLREHLVSAVVCAPLQEVNNNFFQLVEVISKICGLNTPILITLCGLHCKLLTEVDFVFKNLKKSKDQATGRQLLVADLLSSFSSNSTNLVVSALSGSSSSLRKQAECAYNFLQSLPFSVLFSAIMQGIEGKSLTFELLSAALNSSYSSISARDQLAIMRMILSCIQKLASSTLECLDKKHRLSICFNYLKRLVSPKSLNLEGGQDTVSKEILLCKDMVIKSLTHPAISEFCMCPTAMEPTSGQHRKGARLLDEYIMDYLKFLLSTCSAIDLHEKSESVAELLGSLQETTFQACKPLVQQAMTLFLLKWQGKVPGEDETTFSLDFQLIQTFLLELAGHSDPNHFVFFLSDLMSCKSGRTPSGVSPSSVFLKLAQLFYEKWSQIEQRNGCNAKSNAPLVQETTVAVFRYVVNEVLKDATEDGDRCLLSALQISTSDSEVGFSSTSSDFSLLVRVTPIDVIDYCIRYPTVVRGNIAKILVQTSTTHRNEFGRLLCMGTGEEMFENGDLPLEMTSRIFGEAKSQTEEKHFSLSHDDLLLLLPAAKVFLCKYHSSSTTRVVVHVASTYLKLLTTHIKRWDEFVLQLVNLIELGLAVPKTPSENHRVEELAGLYFNDLLVLMRKCLAICPISSKKRVSLLLKLLPKVGLPFVDLRKGSFQGTEAELFTLFFQLYGKAAVARQILSDIEAKVTEEFSAGMSISKQQKFRSLMAETVMRFATGLGSTLTLIFKATAEIKKHSPSLCIPQTYNVLGALEEYLQLQLVEVVASMDTTGVEADITSLFVSYAKTCLRYRFGKAEGMKVLRALAMRLANLSDDYTVKRKDTASSVLELVLSHSQFVPYILSCGTASRPLPMNLGRQAGKGTVLISLPSILSLIGSPIVASGEQTSGVTSDMESTSVSGVQDLHMDNGIDALSGVSEGSQLALLELVRSLFQLKVYSNVGMLSTEDRATMEELLSLLLAAYGATTNNIDTEIYALMCELEFYGGPGYPGLAGMDYLWGEAALKRKKAKVEKFQSIDENMDTDENITETRKRTFKEDLTLDPRRCGLSILCFSTLAQHAISLGIPDLGANSKKGFQGVAYDAEEHYLRAAAYDPRFILPFALHGLSEGCIGTEEFVCLGLLGLAITSLSSSEEGMRKLGYKILAKYLASLEEGSTFKGQPQIRMLLTYVKNAVTEEWQQLPFVLMLFAAESSCILMHPENPHFMTVTRYLLKGPALDLEYVPLFHSMFGSGSPRYRSERLWMLRLLACGFTSSRDSRVFRRQFVLEILMSFYSSPLADSFTRKWVLQVLMKATRVRGCVQALVERSGFLLWLASAAVSYMDLSISEQDAKEASDLPIMVLEIMERLLRWKFLEQRCLGEGMAELTTAALTLRYFLTHCTTPKQRAVFRRPTIRIMTYVLRLSQRRKKYETHFSLSLHNVVEAIHWVESEGPDSGYGVETTGETRALALHMLLHSSPPAASSLEDKQLLSKVASWAVPVIIRGLVTAGKKELAGGGHLEPKKISEGLPEKLVRWLTASLVLGKLASARNKLGLTKSHADTHPTCLSILYGSQSIQSADFHPVNKELATQLLQLQMHFSGKDLNPLVTALASLWPFHNPEGMLTGDELIGIATSLIQRILSNISAPHEAEHSWRWSFNNAWRKKETPASGNVSSYIQISSFEGEISQIALIVFQQLVLEPNPSGLALLISQSAKGLDVSSSSNKVYLKEFIEKLDHSIEELRRTHVISQ